MSGSNMNHNGEGFKKLVSRRPDYLLKILKKYPRIIFTDIDTIWFIDPRPYLTGDYDFWAQIDGIIDGKPYFSGFIHTLLLYGFFGITSNWNINEFIKEMVPGFR